MLYSTGSLVTDKFPSSASLTLLILFTLRMFDDLKNRVSDQGKSNRNYTDVSTAENLKKVNLLLYLLTPLIIYFIHPYIAFYTAIFLACNIILYQIFSHYKSAMLILPLIKYPFICMMLAFLNRNESNSEIIFTSVSLLPVFIIFESFDDDKFRLSVMTSSLLFLSVHILLLIQASDIYIHTAVTVLSLAIFMLSANHLRTYSVTGYLVLLYFLIFRLLPI
jgi:hypothetical protein